MARSRFQNLPIERQDEILGLAAREFARAGFHGTSYNQLLERLKLGKGSAYYYFDDKRDLFCTVIKRCYDRYFQAVGALAPPRNAKAFWRFFERASKIGFDFLTDDPTTAGMMLCLHREAGGRELLTNDLLDAIATSYDRVLREGQRLGAVRSDLPRHLLLEVLRSTDMTFDLWFFAEREKRPRAMSSKRAAEIFTDLCRRVLKK